MHDFWTFFSIFTRQNILPNHFHSLDFVSHIIYQFHHLLWTADCRFNPVFGVYNISNSNTQLVFLAYFFFYFAKFRHSLKKPHRFDVFCRERICVWRKQHNNNSNRTCINCEMDFYRALISSALFLSFSHSSHILLCTIYTHFFLLAFCSGVCRIFVDLFRYYCCLKCFQIARTHIKIANECLFQWMKTNHWQHYVYNV